MKNKDNNTDKKKKYRPSIQWTTIRRMTVLVLAFAVLYIPESIIPRTSRIFILIPLLLIWIFLESATLRLSHAKGLLQRRNFDKGWDVLKKLVKTPIVPLASDEKMMIATAFIQNSEDPHTGIELLEKWLSKKQSDYNTIRGNNILSMGYFRIGEKDKAISLMQNLYNNKLDDISVLVNLSHFLLDSGRYEEAFDIIEKGGNNVYMLDNLGCYYIVNGMHKQAIELYREIYDNMQPRFVEFYIHAMQSELYYRCNDKAKDMLERGFTCPRLYTSNYTKEYLERLESDLKTTGGCLKINSASTLVAFGRDYSNSSDSNFVPPTNEEVEYYNREID